MADYKGTLRDSLGNPLYPRSVAEQIIVTVDGEQLPLDEVLQGFATTAVVSETEITLENALDPGDLYSVPEYAVGNCHIQMWLDGVYLHGGDAGMWQEYGTAGETSTVVLINDEFPAQSVITVRVAG